MKHKLVYHFTIMGTNVVKMLVLVVKYSFNSLYLQ